METRVLQAVDSAEIAAAAREAAELLRHGAVVAVPTETVYGLACDALNAEAAAKVFAAKERPAFDPLITLLCRGRPSCANCMRYSSWLSQTRIRTGKSGRQA